MIKYYYFFYSDKIKEKNHKIHLTCIVSKYHLYSEEKMFQHVSINAGSRKSSYKHILSLKNMKKRKMMQVCELVWVCAWALSRWKIVIDYVSQ